MKFKSQGTQYHPAPETAQFNPTARALFKFGSREASAAWSAGERELNGVVESQHVGVPALQTGTTGWVVCFPVLLFTPLLLLFPPLLTCPVLVFCFPVLVAPLACGRAVTMLAMAMAAMKETMDL